MGRPLKTLRPVPLNVSLDEDVAGKMDLELWSELEGKVPFGAKSALINKLLRTYFRSMAGKRNAARLAGDFELAALSGIDLGKKEAEAKALKKLDAELTHLPGEGEVHEQP